jgi:hypothetical protein
VNTVELRLVIQTESAPHSVAAGVRTLLDNDTDKLIMCAPIGDSTKLTLPTVHTNGTSAEMLTEHYADAAHKLREAVDAMRRIPRLLRAEGRRFQAGSG